MKTFLSLCFSIGFGTTALAADPGAEARYGQEHAQRVQAERNVELNSVINSCTSTPLPRYSNTMSGVLADFRSLRNPRVRSEGARLDVVTHNVGRLGDWAGLTSPGEHGPVEKHVVTFSFTESNGASHTLRDCLLTIAPGGRYPEVSIKDCEYPRGYKGPAWFKCGIGSNRYRRLPSHSNSERFPKETLGPIERDRRSEAVEQ